MSGVLESADDVLKACAEVRQMYPHTPVAEMNKVFVPMVRYVAAHKNELAPQAVEACFAVQYWMAMGEEPAVKTAA
jgi:hypothetical protein